MSIYNFRPNYGDAIISLSGGKALGGPTDGPVTKWQFDKGATIPTEAEIDDEVIRLQAEYDAQEYARNRKPEYPDIGDQLDDLYHKGAFSDEMAVKIKAVKDAHPKPE